jgi:transposase
MVPHLPLDRPKPKGGRPRLPDRQVMDAIVFVARTGCQWNTIPRQVRASSTVHGCFQQWVADGVFLRLGRASVPDDDAMNDLPLEWHAVDGAMIKAPLGGNMTGPNPTDRGTSGTKQSLLTDGNGIPLGVAIAGATRNDRKLVEATLCQLVIGWDEPTAAVQHVYLDNGYDYDAVGCIHHDVAHRQHRCLGRVVNGAITDTDTMTRLVEQRGHHLSVMHGGRREQPRITHVAWGDGDVRVQFNQRSLARDHGADVCWPGHGFVLADARVRWSGMSARSTKRSRSSGSISPQEWVSTRQI